MTAKLKVSQTAYTALEESVKHWEDNYNNYPNLKLGSDNCPLCQVFATDWNPCNGGPAGEVCPISRKVKDTCCDNTPYDDVYYHYKKAVNVSLSVSPEKRS